MLRVSDSFEAKLSKVYQELNLESSSKSSTVSVDSDFFPKDNSSEILLLKKIKKQAT